jgi:PAS domain S-box-containing protein
MNVGFRLQTKSGPILTVGGTASMLSDEAGTLVGWIIMAQDLPAVDAAERRRLEEFQRVAFEQVNEAIVVVDLSTLKVVDVNEHACRIYGYSREEFLALDTSALRPPGAEVSDAGIIMSLQRTGIYQSDQELIRRKGGSSFPGSLNIRLVSIGGKPFSVAIVRDLTAQRRAEEFQRVLFDQAGEAIVVVDLSTRRILDANARACELHGYPREEFLGLRIDDIVSADAETQAQVPVVARMLAEQNRYEGRRTHRRKDGTLFPCSLTLKTVVIGGRRLVIGVHRDLTEELKAAEFHRILFEQAGEAVVIVDHPSRKVLDANDKAADMHGYTREEFLRLRVEDYAAPPLPGEVLEIAQALTEHGRYEGRQLHRRKDGTLFPCSLNLKTLTGIDRVLVICVHRDLTEELKAEEYHRVLFEQAVDSVLVVDFATRTVIDANDKAAELHGYTREEFLRLGVDDFVVPSTPDGIERMARALEEKGHFEGRLFHRRKDGSTFPCSVNLKTVTIGGRRRVIAVHRDVTAELKAEEFFRVLFEQAVDAILVIDLVTREVLDANDKAVALHGYSREEFLRLRVDDFVVAVTPDEVQRIGRELEEKGRFEGRQLQRRRDGSVFPCSLNLKTVVIGGRKRVIAVQRDVTEELKAEEFFRVLFQRASDAVYLVKDDGLRVVEANETACRMLGYTREEFLKLGVADLVPPAFRHRISEFHESLKKGPGYRRDRRMLSRKDGSTLATDQAVSRVEISGRPYYIASCRDLTEQERVARELEEAKSFLEHVQENASDGLALLDENGIFVAVNRKFHELRGERRDQILGTHWMERTPPEKKEAYRQFWTRILEGERSSIRTSFERPGAAPVHVDVSSAVILRGERRFVFSIVRDVSEQVKLEEQLELRVTERTTELRQSEARFRSITEATPLPVTITRPDGAILYVNEAASRLFRLGAEGTAGRNAADFYADPADRAVLKERLLKEGAVSGNELMFRRLDGTLFWTVVNLRLMTFEGEPAILGSFVDIDERKRSEEALRESEMRFRAITEGVPVAVVIARASDGGILYANETAAKALGLPQGNIEARTVGEFLARPRDREEIQERLTRDGFVRDLELQFRKLDGTRFWGISSLRLATYKGERATLGVFSDISARKKAEELLRKAHEELELRVVERTAELARANALLQDEIAERKRAENTLRVILEGTAAVTGGSFFRSLSRHLASALNVRYALVVQGIGRPAVRARTIAFWNGSDFAGPVEYEVRGTPCEDVLAGEACCYSHDVQRLFPDFKMLAQLGVDSYLGVPIADSTGAVVGQLVVMDVGPVSDVELKLSVLKIFAARAGVELERQLAEEALRVSEERWRSLVANAPDFILTVDRAGLIQSINRTVPGLRVDNVIGKHVFEFTDPETRGKVQEALDKAFKEGKSHAYETRAVGPNGGEAWYDTRVGPIKIGDQVTGATFIATDITERRAADKALRESEERWRSLVANAPDIITTVDREGRLLSINRLFSSRLEDLVGKPVYGFVPPEFVERVRLAIDTVFREGRSVSYETLSGGANGSKAWYSSRVGPIMLDGRVAAATIISTDITERWKAEQRQKVQHEVTRILAESASLEEAVPRMLEAVCEGLDWQIGLLWKVDGEAGVLRLADERHPSKAAGRDFVDATRGFTFQPGLGLPGRVWKVRLSQWIPDVSQDANFPRRPAATRSGMRAAFAVPVEGPQGIFGVLEFLSTEVRERDESLLRVITTLGSQLGQFIERKRAEGDLRFQKSLLESQSEAAIDGILVVSRDGIMTSFNRRFCQMWEIPDQVLRSRSDEGALQAVLKKLKDPKEFIDRVRYLYDHPDQESRDEIHLKDGRAIDRYSAPVKGAAGELYGRVWYFRDVTGRKQTEENLRRAAAETRQMYENLKEAQAQLIRSEKLASIGMLVSGVAHEINNPLNVMYGNLQLLAEVSDVLLPLSVEGARSKKIRGTVAKVSKFRGMIRDALKAARHAREIVMDFRNFARDTRTAELVDLNQCLEEAVTLIQRELRPGIRVVRKLGRIPQVRCLRGQISQVFLNLLKNAGESIEKKGTVTLRTLQKNGHVMVEVADTGRGMPEEVRRKLFEPFFTTKPVGKGLGLGLSISAMIVHNHNGNITVNSAPGRGSVFRVELPLPP